MKILRTMIVFLTVLSMLVGCNLPVSNSTPPPATNAPGNPETATTTKSQPSPATSTSLPPPAATASPHPNPFGFFVGKPNQAVNAKVGQPLKDIGNVGWVRLNVDLGVKGQDYTPYLAAGFNVILTIINQDPNNIVTDYGTLKDNPAAGFPFKQKDQYEQDVRALLQPALPYMQQGRQVWVQAENEEIDATVEKNAMYWRGTDDQYVAESQAFYEAVKSVSPNIQVVLTSFASYMLDFLDDSSSAGHAHGLQHVNLLLAQAKYDALDLHFYGCLADIPAKIKTITGLVPAGKPATWISTENGGPDFRCTSTPATYQQGPAQFEQAKVTQLPERLSACIDNGGSVCLWFSFYDLSNASDTFSHFGVVNLDGDVPVNEPAYAAYQAFITKALTAAPVSVTPNSAKGKPNIIFILTDDLNAEEFQYMPQLKALIADQGVTFSNYFVPESLCCPSRSSTQRGQYPHNTKIFTNNLPLGGFGRFFNLDEENSTIAVWLQNAGYRTMLVGKYLNGYPGKNGPAYIPPGWNEWYSAVNGDAAYSEYNYILNENGQKVSYGNKPEDYGTDVYVGKAVDFIQRTAKTGQPFFMYLAPYAPHAPYTPAPRHANLFPDAKAPRSPNYNEADVSDKPGYLNNLPLITQKQMDTIDNDYRNRLRSLQAVDEGIQKIVNTLQAAGQLDNTYIFFTSDNGYHLGNHRMLEGKIAPYEEELHLILEVRGPNVPAGKTLDHLVGNIDLAPTWAELGGATAADFVDGRSLLPLLSNNPTPLAQWRHVFSLEWGPDPLEEQAVAKTPVPQINPGEDEPPDPDQVNATALPPDKQKKLVIPYFRGVRLQTMSYVEYRTGEVELYDLKADPYELNNLAPKADPKLLAQFAQRVKDLATCKAASCRTVEDEPFNVK